MADLAAIASKSFVVPFGFSSCRGRFVAKMVTSGASACGACAKKGRAARSSHCFSPHSIVGEPLLSLKGPSLAPVVDASVD